MNSKDLMEELRTAGVLPTGPVSAWPQSRNIELMKAHQAASAEHEPKHAIKVKADFATMAKGLVKTGVSAVRNGKVAKEVREERYSMCKQCPAFIENSKRCSECGCFMEAKTWVNGNPKVLCPLKKWKR